MPRQISQRLSFREGFKPIPDEEGTEMRMRPNHQSTAIGFKPIPDEEGTEINSSVWWGRANERASNRSPMRRGLK